MMILLHETNDITEHAVKTTPVYVNKYQIQALRVLTYNGRPFTEIYTNKFGTVVTETIDEVVALMENPNAASAQK